MERVCGGHVVSGVQQTRFFQASHGRRRPSCDRDVVVCSCYATVSESALPLCHSLSSSLHPATFWNRCLTKFDVQDSGCNATEGTQETRFRTSLALRSRDPLKSSSDDDLREGEPDVHDDKLGDGADDDGSDSSALATPSHTEPFPVDRYRQASWLIVRL